MRLVAIGDVGVISQMIHIGDEAMFEALLDQMRRRGYTVTAISSVPEETAARYGVDSVQRIGFDFSAGRAAAEDRLRAVLRCAAGEQALPPEDSVWPVIEAIRAADGVVVAGGGNLASTWPTHIFERYALSQIAQRTGTPFVVSGQTIGPVLEPADEELVTALLSSAALVGVREPSSESLVLALGVPAPHVQLTVDDASFLGDPADLPTSDRPYALVSLSTHLGGRDRTAVVARLAELLDRLVEQTGLEVCFHAHFASLADGEVRGDSVLHAEVSAAMTVPSRVEPTTDSAAAARLARGAQLLLTGRYHPAVFAVPAGVPTIGIAVDDYTRVKLTGALGNFGQTAVLPIDDLVEGRSAAVVDRVWRERHTIRRIGLGRTLENRPASELWWDRVAAQF